MSTIISLGKLRFQFRGDYSASSVYEYNDVVRFGGDVYVYINSTASTPGTDPSTTSHWARMVSGLKANGAWSSATSYAINDVVTHGGSAYRAVQATTNNIPPNATYWELLVGGVDHKGTWQTATSYLADDAVVLYGQTYRATTNFTSAATLLADLLAGNWARYSGGSFNRGAYTQSTDYYKGDLVQTGAGASTNHYISTTDHASDATADPSTGPENTNWTLLISGTYTTTNADRQYAFFMGLST